MSRHLHIFFFIIVATGYNGLYGQRDKSGKLLHIYIDNDFLNVRGKGTDKAYTAGIRFDLFYTPAKKRVGFPSRLIPEAGDSSINTSGWGIMQVLFTPENIQSCYYQPNDYSYSAALFVIRSFYSYSMLRQYDFQTEIIMGIRGPTALGKQTQINVHRFINDKLPGGWNNQLRNAPIFNINITGEKMISVLNSMVEIIGGVKLYLGTMMNAVTMYPPYSYRENEPVFQRIRQTVLN